MTFESTCPCYEEYPSQARAMWTPHIVLDDVSRTCAYIYAENRSQFFFFFVVQTELFYRCSAVTCVELSLCRNTRRKKKVLKSSITTFSRVYRVSYGYLCSAAALLHGLGVQASGASFGLFTFSQGLEGSFVDQCPASHNGSVSTKAACKMLYLHYLLCENLLFRCSPRALMCRRM